ncbi:uncharacterized protein LOC120645620 [Panicum virgatum]|uniref:uncharacterized protein LOC120645620 n=1 Tax=Panicum virgatum TaxID=38727 RepID=UPI0019D64535|nr:uncharacterized protein LOC120645620 [Panicum virgatum]
MTTAEAMAARRPSPPRGGGGVRGTRAASRNRPRARPRGGHGGVASAGGPPTSLCRIRKSAAPAAGAPPLHLERAGQGPLSGGLELRCARKRAGPGSAALGRHRGTARARPRGGHGGASSADDPPTSLSRIQRSATPAAGAPPLHLERARQGPLSGGFELRRAGERMGPGASTAAAHVGGPASQQRVGMAPAAASSSLCVSSLCPLGRRACRTASGGRCHAVQ